jgi:hypothetical protein
MRNRFLVLKRPFNLIKKQLDSPGSQKTGRIAKTGKIYFPDTGKRRVIKPNQGKILGDAKPQVQGF